MSIALNPSTAVLTPLAGREREVAELLALIRRPAMRLVTVSGPGGVGKTRLALQVAEASAGDFAGGVAFVRLDPIRDPALVVATIARALGLREAGSESWFERLTAYLRGRDQLLVLDNFEQIIEAAPVVSDLLAVCPGLTILVTSREVLRLTGEGDFPLSPLDLPAVGDASIAAIEQTGAVTLFVQRARAANPGFRLTPEVAPVVAEICRRLDGLPLAVELAASRIRMLSSRALLARLDQRLMLLTGGARDQPTRLQTMRDAIAWSCDLLVPAEQTLFRRLSVFAGGFGLEAAEYVGGQGDRGTGGQNDGPLLSPCPPVPLSPFDGVASLVEKSLVRPMDEGKRHEPRFAMLETIREFGVELLGAAGEEDETRRCHARWMLGLAERAEPELVGPRQEEWLDRLEAEHDNARAALAWAIETRDAETAQRLVGAFWRFWATRGYLTEGKTWTERALALGDASPAVAAKAHHHLGNIALDLGDYELARTGYDAGLALWQGIDDRRGLASSYNGLGLLAFYQADYREARRLHETSLAIRHELDDRQGLGNSYSNLGNVANAEGDYARARELHEQALAVRQGMGNTGGVAYTLFNLGDVARQEGDFERARRLFDQSLDLFREVGDILGVGYALYDLGKVAHLQKRDEVAAALFAEAIRLRQELGDKRGLVECLEGLAPVAHGLGDLLLAGHLFGAVEALREALDVPLPPTEIAAHTRDVAALRGRLGAGRSREAWDAGRAMTLEQAIDAAQALTTRIPTPTHVPEATTPVDRAARFNLSEREIEVLRLVAAGQTDREIAETLFISPRTANVHVANLRGKLGVSSRAAAVALAHRHGLV
ncbi:MAG TPA: tetratricopeptide repeat protein [Thermomicrobiales bacterium]|jgi:predicted ATPase/DNA-binding CsgD family transcriptional regulator